MIYLYNAVLLSHEKEENHAICNIRKDPGDIMLSEISSTEKDQYCMVLLTYGILKKKKSNS